MIKITAKLLIKKQFLTINQHTLCLSSNQHLKILDDYDSEPNYVYNHLS